MLLLCREAFAPIEGGKREGGCDDMTGGVEEPDAKREREREREKPGARGRRMRSEGRGRRENRWNEIKGEGRRRGWRRAGGEAKSMHRGGMQRCARQYGALRQRVHIPPRFIPTAASLPLSLFFSFLRGLQCRRAHARARTHTRAHVCARSTLLFRPVRIRRCAKLLYATHRWHCTVDL